MDNTRCSISVLLFLICSSNAFAAPDSTSVSGTVQDGESITISGSGFGATGPNVVFFDSFEKGTNGALISLVTGSADIGEWDAVYNSGGPDNTYSTSFSHSGSKSMLSDYRTYWGGGPNTRFPDVQNSNILISFWAMIPTGRDVPGTNSGDGPNWKLFWTGDRNDAFPWGSDMSIECISSDCSNTETIAALDDVDAPARFGGGPNYNFALVKGQWRRVTVAMRNATSDAFVWQQEVGIGRHEVIVNETNVVTAHSNDAWNFVAIPGFGRHDSNSLVFTDDVYIATGDGARARVEIGNASTYTACTNLAIITPTSWGNTSITATVRQGSFTSGSAYLYVTDASGVTETNGLPITIGGSPPGPTCSDGIQNGDETGVDCGGSCSACSAVSMPIGAGSMPIGAGSMPISVQ